VIIISDGKWISGLGAMAYRNIGKRITIRFHKKGKTFERKPQDMSVELLEKCSALPQGGV
jgi:hypothetical protein